MDNLEGKVAFITGGASGIGLGMSKAFCSASIKVIKTFRPENLRRSYYE